MVRTCFYFDVLGFELEHLAVALDPATSNLFTPTLKEEGKHTSDTPGQYPYDRQHKRSVALDKIGLRTPYPGTLEWTLND